MNITIAQFKAADLQSAAEVLRQFGQRPTLDHLRAFLASDRNFFVVASASGAWAGFAYGYELLRPDYGSMLFLYSIDVLPQYRRRGVATAMLLSIRKTAEARHMTEMFVFTTHSNKAAVELYKATGGIIENGDDLLFVYPNHALSQTAEPNAPANGASPRR